MAVSIRSLEPLSLIRNNAFAICQMLLQKGAAPGARTREGGRTTLILMARYRVFHKKIVEVLSSSVNVAGNEGRTALTFAVEGQGLFGQRRGNINIARLLLKIGANASIKDCRGRTALDYAIATNDTHKNDAMIKFLQSVGQ